MKQVPITGKTRRRRLCRAFSIVCLGVLLALLAQERGRSQTTWTNDNSPVLGPGPGWESLWVHDLSVIDEDSQYVMWYTGGTNYNGIDLGIGRATSPDGMHWTKDTLNPVMRHIASSSWDGGAVWIPKVLKIGTGYTMWFTGANSSLPWQIGRATSKDGRVWTQDSTNPVLRVGAPGQWDAALVHSGSVLFDGATYRMWYTGLSQGYGTGTVGIGLATSSDGIHWVKDTLDNPVLAAGPAGSWDQHGVGESSVVYDSTSKHYLMFYDGNELDWFTVGTSGIGAASSPDGIHWTKFTGNPVLRNNLPGSWTGAAYGPVVLLKDSTFHMWYGGDASGETKVGYATSPRTFPAPIINVSTASLDFGPLAKAASDTLTLTVSNMGEKALTLQSIDHTSATVSGWPVKVIAPPPPFAIQPGGSFPVFIAFTPKGEGVFDDTLMIRSDDPSHSIIRVPITASAVDSLVPAQQGVLYVSCYPPSGGALFSLNASNATADSLGSMGISGISGLSIRHSDGIIYGALASSTSSGVYQVSASNGRAGLVRRFPVGNIVALAFDASDTLYGGSSTGTLYRLDILSGAVDSIGTTKGLAFTGLSFRPRTGELWGSVRLPLDNIYVISRKTGIATLVGATGFSSTTAGIAFDSGGKLLAIIDNRFGTDYLASIDTLTAIGSTIGGPLVVNNIHGIAITGQELQTSVKDQQSAAIPLVSSLEQNWPNPFNPSTTIKYAIAGARGQESGVRKTSLVVYDMLGRKVATLVDEMKAPGSYEVRFDASGLASGVYFYRLEAGSFVETRKLLLVR